MFNADAVEFMKDKLELEFVEFVKKLGEVIVAEVSGEGMLGQEGEFANCSVAVELNRHFLAGCPSDV